jgi:hypothetical protein
MHFNASLRFHCSRPCNPLACALILMPLLLSLSPFFMLLLQLPCADEAKSKKLQEQLVKSKEKNAELTAELSTKQSELAKAHEQLAAALSRIEISSAAAVGEVQNEKINEAYKEGQRDAQRFLKEMRSFFP